MSVNRRQLILDAAAKSFSLFGYKATTMDQVAKIANVGKGTIYTFFRNKEELFKEIVHRLIEEMKAAADETLDSSLSLHENIHQVLYRMLEYRRDHQFMIKLIQEKREMGTPAVIQMVEEVEEAIVSYISSRIKKAIENGRIVECDPELTSFLLFKMYITLIFDWEKKHKPLEKSEIAQLLELYIFKGLSHP
ncbi:TetR/AcrR family transcriptional regulator [Peribacillus deserti]|uniref:TetR family transcriptional regulator n=1 Tax=Peribacillus deserti TaxID=673318 RepID=A0A2N5M0C2_9BACI|nr:TetR/AcrR family transcriptional regulator [Peribacillus deserti]PLT27723.1 TetR family transcriptional regulator [Peribacillus deserti]